MSAKGYSGGKGSAAARGKGKGRKDAVESSRDQLATYLRNMLARLTSENFSVSAGELKEKIMPSIAESIQRLSAGAPDEVREELKANLLEKSVLPDYDADADALCSALSACQATLARSGDSGGTSADKAENEAANEGNGTALPQSRKGKKGGGHKGDEKGKGRGRRGKADSESAISSDAASKLSSLKVSFCPDPRSIGAKFTATYEPSPTCNFASLNAGDNAFFVGGKTINGQFANDLWNQAWQDTGKYKAMHERLFRTATPGELTAASPEVLAGDPNVCAAYVRILAASQRVGSVFIDIFKEDLRPHHAKNIAMIYTVGCQRRECKSDAEFLDTVRAIAGNVSMACCEYNASKASPSLEMVRVCLISGGAFAGKVPKADVADAIILGIADGSLCVESPVFEFSYDGDEFQAAWKRLTST